MAQLHALVAATPSAKTNYSRSINTAIHELANERLINGIIKTYSPLDENDAEIIDSEHKPVQVRVSETIDQVKDSFTRCLDLTLQQDIANTVASADIIIGDNEETGTVIAEEIPVTHLMWLEKRLDELVNFVQNLPILRTDIANWRFDAQSGVFRSPQRHRNKTRKVEKALTLAPATDKHPAQVKTVVADEVIGHTSTVEESGAVPLVWKRERLAKLLQLRDAVVAARVRANAMEVTPVPPYASKLFDFVFDEEIK